MKRPDFLLKLAALVSSLLLLGGYVAYQAGAFNWLSGTSAQKAAIMGSSKSKTLLIVPPSADTPAEPSH